MFSVPLVYIKALASCIRYMKDVMTLRQSVEMTNHTASS